MSEQRSEIGQRLFFDEHQWATVEAAMARLIPTDHEPGAREANTVGFLDGYLSGIGYIYAKPDGSGFEELTGLQADAWRQRVDSLRETYTEGLRELDQRSSEMFGEGFRHLSEDRQDSVLAEVEAGPGENVEARQEESATAGYGSPEVAEAPEPGMQQVENEFEMEFFDLLVLHTRQGFYSDPIYGGNTDHVGWQVIGFPGPASLEEAYSGRYTTLPYFANDDSDREAR